MPMTLKLSEIVNAKPIFEKIIHTPMSLKMNSRITRMLKLLNAEFQHFEEQRINLIKKIGTEKEDGSYEIDNESKDLFFKELTEYLKEDIEIAIMPLNIDDLPSSIELTPVEYSQLEPFLVPEDE